MKKRKLNRIGIMLKEKGHTNIWLAQQLKRHVNTISKWTSNAQQPHLEVLFQISVLLACDIRELIISTQPPGKGEKRSID